MANNFLENINFNLKYFAFAAEATPCFLPAVKPRDPRVRQAVMGVLIVVVFSILFLGFQFGRFLPGLAGEWFARMGGFFTTPFFMEFGIFCLGFVALLTINHWRQKREGDEFVYLEVVETPPPDMPAASRAVVFAEKPSDRVSFPEIAQLEGAIEAGDFGQAGGILASMSEAELTGKEVMRLRIRLADATGKKELAERLRQQLGEENI